MVNLEQVAFRCGRQMALAARQRLGTPTRSNTGRAP